MGEYLNKTNTILDFLQMIFKVIIQNLQTSNTSASQNNNQRQHQKTIRIFEAEKISWGVGFSKTKTRDTDVIPQGVLGVSSDGDDQMEPKVKTQKNP